MDITLLSAHRFDSMLSNESHQRRIARIPGTQGSPFPIKMEKVFRALEMNLDVALWRRPNSSNFSQAAGQSRVCVLETRVFQQSCGVKLLKLQQF